MVRQSTPSCDSPVALLINPPIYDFAAFDLWLKPLGLLYIASALERAGFVVRLLDCLDRLHPLMPAVHRSGNPRLHRFGCGNFYSEEVPKPRLFSEIPRRYKRYGLPQPAIKQFLSTLFERGRQPDVIAITSVMTYWYQGVFEMVRLCKELFPAAPIVLGGIYATLCEEHARRNSGADFVLTGRAEDEIVRLACRLCGFPPTPKSAPPLAPAYHLYPSLRYAAVITSRGCPFRCAYCASHLLNPGFSQRDPAQVADEIRHIVERFNIADIAFYDDALLIKAENHLLPLLDRLVEARLGLRLHTPNGLHASMITADVARAMRESGFATVRVSLESCAELVQRASDYKVTREIFIAAMQNLHSAGYSPRETEVYLLIGVPHQTLGDIEETIRFVHENRGWIKLAQFSPIPGTQIFRDAAELLPGIREEPLLQNNSTFLIMSGSFSYETLKQLKTRVHSLNGKLLGAGD